MEETFLIGPFNVQIFLREVKIGRSGAYLAFNPPSLNTAADLVLTAMKIESFKTVPEKLASENFIIHFDSERTLSLGTDQKNSSVIKFTFDEGDTLIKALNSAYQKWIDVTLTDHTREVGIVPQSEVPDAPFDSGI